LLLHGPIDIRLGVLMLNEGNTTVLGGSVQSMVDVQIKARAQAQRLAGVGVDPTVKALIWNPDTGIDDEGADEGEGESGDVARRRVTATGTMFGGGTAAGIDNFGPAAPAALPPPPLPAATVATVASRSTEDHDQSMPPPRSMAPNLYGQPNQMPQPIAKQAPQNTYGQTRPVPANAYFQPPQSTARARPTAPAQNTYAQPSQTLSSAPPRPSPAASSALTPLRNPTIAAAVATYSNPYAAKTKTTYATPRAPTNNVAYPRTNNSQSSPDEYTVDLTQDEPSVLLRPACPSSSSSRRALSFSDLWSMLEQARTDRDLYEANQSTIFLVQGKMTGPHRYFNIEKNRGTRSSSDEKYKYVMVIHFTGGDGGNTITTTVANALSQPYFCVGPTEMRKLSKLNRADADAKAREGGFAVQKELMELAQWEMKLNMTGDEFFSIVPFPRMDGDDAILELLRKSG
jgi:RecQ mediated genome instability protein